MISTSAFHTIRSRLATAMGALSVAVTLLGSAPAARAEDIAIGEGLALAWGQFFVADENKTWQAEGLTPNVITFASGRLALDALVGGRIAIATASETPVLFANLNGLPVRIIGTLNWHEPFDIIAAKDIQTGKDLKGRKVGYAQGTNAHYYLSKVLEANGLTFADITAVNLSPADFVTSLANGSLDAFVWTEPHLSLAIAQGKDRFHTIRNPGLYSMYSNIIALQSTIDDNPELLVKALKALIAADEVIKADRDKSIQTVAKRIELDPEIAANFWDRTNFTIALDKPGIVKLLEAETKWAADNGLVRADAKLPDLNDIVVTGPYEEARKP